MPSECAQVSPASLTLGAVVIGRNEGARLPVCLKSVIAQLGTTTEIVYVDSSSSDNSAEKARGLGIDVVELEDKSPLTAARGRNAGFLRLLERCPAIRFVQFIDGDCELRPGWLESARAAMNASNTLAIACGRRRERFPDASVYNRLCDIEWNTPIGNESNCGGDALVRVSALREIGLYNAGIIAAEDTELCVRLRLAGWTILRMETEMTLHDAAILRFSQWWRRAVRAGHGFAENRALHGASPLRHWVRENRSNWFWGFFLPLVSVAAVWPTRGLSLLLPAAYALLYARIRRSSLRRGMSETDATIYARFGVLAKFPLARGQARYWLRRLTGRRSTIIEYKSAAPPAARISDSEFSFPPGA